VHRDPFDRLLVVQSIELRAPILSRMSSPRPGQLGRRIPLVEHLEAVRVGAGEVHGEVVVLPLKRLGVGGLIAVRENDALTPA
jgi:hypothetical protein